MAEVHVIVRKDWFRIRHRVIFVDGEVVRVDVPYYPCWSPQRFKLWADHVWWWTEAWKSGDPIFPTMAQTMAEAKRAALRVADV